MQKYKPELYPNSKAGKEPDVTKLIADPTDWLYSFKADGGRCQLSNLGAVGRSLKPIPSAHIQRMWKDANLILQLSDGVVIEAEFYSPDMTFAEIMHFFRCEDVTSEKTRKKHQLEWEKTAGGTQTYTKMVKGEPVQQAWEFPGRDVDWLCTWHDSLKFYIFNIFSHNSLDSTKEERSKVIEDLMYKFSSAEGITPKDYIEILHQREFTHVDNLYQAYDQAIMDGYEGLVVMRKDCTYKYGRHSATFKDTFKLKEDNLEFDGIIRTVEEGTQVKAGVAKTENPDGSTSTSQLKDDREPSGLCKGFLVEMEGGNKLTVSLNGYNHEERRAMLLEPEKYIGRWIRFSGMAPVKEGGCPRHAHFTRGNFRDDK